VCGGCVECARVGAERRRRERGAKVRGPLPQGRHQCRSERRAEARQRRQEESGAGRTDRTVGPLLGSANGVSTKSRAT
jgi:hypothetical protein